jgi:hypothetical protein
MNNKWWAPFVHFLVHILVGLMIFLAIAAAAVALDVGVVHNLAKWGANAFTVKMLGLLADALLLTDAVCFVIHLLQSILKALKEIFKK